MSKNSWFNVFAKAAARFSGRPMTFILALLVIVVWAATGPVFAPPAVTAGTLYLAARVSGGAGGLEAGGVLLAVDAASGRELWRAPMVSPGKVSPLVHGDVVYELEEYPEDKTEKDLEKHVAPAIRAWDSSRVPMTSAR